MTIAPDQEATLLHLTGGDAVVLLDELGVPLWVGASIEAVSGFTTAEYLASEPIELIHPDDRRLTRQRWMALTAAPGETHRWELRARQADGSYRWYSIVNLNRLDDPSIGAVICGLTDITGQPGRIPIPADSDQFDRLLRASRDVMGAISVDGTITWISPSVRDMLGYEPQDMVGRPAFDFVEPGDVAAAVERLALVQSGASSVEPIAVQLRHADGSYRLIEIAGAPVESDEGLTGEVIMNLRDIRWRQEALSALRGSERRFRTLADSSPIGIFQTASDAGCTYVNDRWCAITGLDAERARGWGWQDLVHPGDQDRVDRYARSESPPDAARSIDFRIVRPDGEMRWVTAHGSLMHDDAGAVIGAVGTLEDVTDQRAAHRNTSRLTEILEATEDLVAIVDTMDRVLYLNTAARTFLHIPPECSLDELELADAFPKSVAERLEVEIRPAVVRDGRWSGELSLASREGPSLPVTAQFLAHRGLDGDIDYFSATFHDISRRKAYEHRLAHQATHDPLTGLPNRTLLIDRLEGAMARANRHNLRVAVLFLDLDHFKVVNDSLGHGLGDRLLVAIAERLAVTLRPDDTIARFGGDEFVVVCEDLRGQHDAVALAERIDAALAEPFMINQTEIYVGVSIGIALPDGVDADAETLIRDADAAMYRAKDRGRARYEVFDNAMRASAVDRLDIENALRRALERRELRVFYQPVVNLATGRVDGVEALVRWEHPERGLLNPGDFITIAEETGLIVPIGAWVLDQACRQAQRWQASSPRSVPLRVAVNLSGRQLGHPRLIEDVASILAETGIDPSDVELEITESVLMDDVEMSAETLGRLHGLGVKLAVDDFGTGYSSLSYLRRFPVDLLKVDRSFVDGLGEDQSDSAIVTAIITLAHTLGLRAVAEGVESALQLAELRRLGCDRAQGYFMARPASGPEIGELLAGGPEW